MYIKPNPTKSNENELPETFLDLPLHGPLSTETPSENSTFTMKWYEKNIIKQFRK